MQLKQVVITYQTGCIPLQNNIIKNHQLHAFSIYIDAKCKLNRYVIIHELIVKHSKLHSIVDPLVLVHNQVHSLFVNFRK